MELTINISDYLSEVEMKEIAKDEFRSAVYGCFNTPQKIESFLSHMGFKTFEQIIDNETPQYKENIIKGVENAIKTTEKSSYFYNVFREPDDERYFKRPASLGYKYLQEAIENNKDIIENKVKEIMSRLDEDDIRDKIIDIIYDYLCRKPKEGVKEI